MRKGKYGSTPCSGSRRSREEQKASAAVSKRWVRSRQSENLGQQATNYNCYRLRAWEFVVGLGKGVAVCGILSFTFYRSMKIFLWMLPCAIAGPVLERRKRLEKRKKELAGQFKESMMVLASSLSAGYSIENALAASVEELAMLFGS